MSGKPTLSVIMPVLNGEQILPKSVGALEASDLARREWELLIVDDGSVDGSVDWAIQRADKMIEVENGPRGPSFARNLGAKHATGDVLVFVDADVCVHMGVLRRFQALFHDTDRLGAAFGTYDDTPEQPDFLSQYRNLYHRYVHLLGAGDTETFWAGCGAVRRELFLQLKGFDVETYPRPQIEDIELGYRIREAGYEILLDPSIEGTHLKRWKLTRMVKTDLFDRAIPWMRLLLGDGPGGRRPPTLNIGGAEKAKAALMGLSCLLALLGLLLLEPLLVLAALVPLWIIVLLNLPVYHWFARRRGWWFSLRVVPFNLLYYLISGLAVTIALCFHFVGGGRGHSSPVTDALGEQPRDR